MFAKRLQIARRLLGGENYEEIRRNLNVTARTISNINNILAARGEGFRKAHLRLSEIEKKKREREYNRVSKLSKLFKTKPRGQNILPGMAAEGFRDLDRKIAKKIKQQSAGK